MPDCNTDDDAAAAGDDDDDDDDICIFSIQYIDTNAVKSLTTPTFIASTSIIMTL